MSKFDFWIRRIHSLLGVVALGGFLMEHLFTISHVMGGPAVFDAAVHEISNIPFLVPVEIMFIGLPFALHGIIRCSLCPESKEQSYCSMVIGITGCSICNVLLLILHFLFISYHVWTFRIVGKAMAIISLVMISCIIYYRIHYLWACTLLVYCLLYSILRMVYGVSRLLGVLLQGLVHNVS